MRVYPIRAGDITSYLVKDRGAVLVDAGKQGCGEALRRGLDAAGVAPSDLTLVFLTHGHHDHIGALGELRAMSRVPIAINHREAPWVEQGLKPLPRPITAWGTLVMALVRASIIPGLTLGGVPVDIALGDEEFSLEPFGVDGALIFTPGHTAGSMTLVLRSGEAFVGDLAMNGLPLTLRPGKPPFADDPGRLPASWRAVLRAGAKVVYPAHGRPFPAAVLERLR